MVVRVLNQRSQALVRTLSCYSLRASAYQQKTHPSLTRGYVKGLVLTVRNVAPNPGITDTSPWKPSVPGYKSIILRMIKVGNVRDANPLPVRALSKRYMDISLPSLKNPPRVFVILRPGFLSFCVPPFCHFASPPSRLHLENHSGKWRSPKKTAATTLYIPIYFSAT